MLDIFADSKDKDLQGFIVWLPMLAGDSARKAKPLVSTDDRFIVQAWDDKRAIGEAFSKTLKLTRPAWDVYMIYEPGVKWTDSTPPQPSFWMHQLGSDSGAPPGLRLVPEKLKAEVLRRLNKSLN